MNKGQKIAVDYIDNFLTEGRESFAWSDLSNAVKESKAVVKNWMAIRSVLQYYINEGLIKRHDDLRVESYITNK